MSSPTCRFCFLGNEISTDPLISPCKCKGSMKYVHRDCIKKWRRMTTNPELVEKCQLCLAVFELPAHYKLESIPDEDYTFRWFILSRMYIVYIAQFMLNYSFFMFYVQLYIYLYNASSITHSELEQINTLSRVSTFSLITAIYVDYYRMYIQFVKNKQIYITYWLQSTIDTTPDSPFNTLCVSLICFCLIPYFQTIPSALYLITLPRLLYIHKAILLQMNVDNI